MQIGAPGHKGSEMNPLIETEVKIAVADLNAIRERLEAVGAVLRAPRVFERNIRYEDAAGSLTPNEIVLRLRQDTAARLTYKAPPDAEAAQPANVRTRFEAEVTVSDFDTMDVILQRLGFRPHVVYEKFRTTYQLGEAEVVLDEMPFGPFVEVEGPAAPPPPCVTSRPRSPPARPPAPAGPPTSTNGPNGFSSSPPSA